MRVLGIETSSRRGTVALVEDGRVATTLTHDDSPAQAEQALAFVERALAAVGWSRSSLDRVAVGIGPGSFTSMRVGIALAQGIGLGLGRPVLGVGALRAMCRGVPGGTPGVRCALLDARRGEIFAAAYDSTGAELAAPALLSKDRLAPFLGTFGAAGVTVVGELARDLDLGEAARRHDSPETDLPHAVWVATLGLELDVARAVAEPLYVREADAIRPNLPRSPLSSGEPT